MDRGVDVVRYFPARGKFVSLAIACGMLGIAFAVKVASEGVSLPNLFGSAFFLFGSINCVQSLDRRRCYIELSPEGFVERSPLRKRLVRWSEVDAFELIPLPRRFVWVGYRPAVPDDPHLPDWARRARCRFASLADTYGLDASALVDQLNAWKRRFESGNP